MSRNISTNRLWRWSFRSCFAPELVAGRRPVLYRLLLHKYYVDEIYDAAVVERTKDLGTLLGRFDANVIDGVGVDGAAGSRASAQLFRCGGTSGSSMGC